VLSIKSKYIYIYILIIISIVLTRIDIASEARYHRRR